MLHQSIRILAKATLFGLWALTSHAETRVISLDEQPDWNAVGRVNKAGFNTTSSCTGTLIAPNFILTAAHCTPRGNTGPLVSNHIFVAGWNRGEYAIAVKFAEVFLPENHQYGPLEFDRIHTDIALVRLAESIPEDIVRPMLLSTRPDTPLGFIGYRNDRLHAPQISTNCDQEALTDNVIFMDCEVVSGNSGSPVLDMTPVGPRVVGVVSASSGESALAVLLQDWMRPFLPQTW